MKRSSTLIIALAATSGLLVTACSDDKGGSAGDFCTMARAFDESQAETDALFDGAGTPEEIEKAFADAGKQIDALVDAAPAEIKKDAKTVQQAFELLDEILAKYDYDFAKLATDPEALTDIAAFDSEEFDTAGANLDTYLEDTCGIATES